jgi:hypothetical protein
MPHPAESAIVPTVTDLDEKWGLRKESLRSIGTVEKEAALSASFDKLAAALGKRSTRPLIFIDNYARQLICQDASIDLLGWRRGFNPRAGQDAFIETEMARIDAAFDSIRSGKIEIYFIDSTTPVHEQGPRGGGDVTPDAWAKCRPWAFGFPGKGCC